MQAVAGPGHKAAWETYARAIFEALVAAIPPRCEDPRLRFLQYVNSETESWWAARTRQAAVVL